MEEAKQITRGIIEEYGIDLIAVGNGTASRETEAFVAELIRELDRECYYVIVNEAGASVYSASKTAREEFPTWMRPPAAPSPSPAGCRIPWRNW